MVEDEAPDVTYSSNTRGLGAAAAKTTTTTTITTQTQYGQGQAQGQLIQGQVIQGGQAGLTTTTTTTETNYGAGMGIATGTRKSVDISKLATTKTINEGVDIKSLEIYNKTTLLQDKVQHIIKREIQPIIKTIIKPII